MRFRYLSVVAALVLVCGALSTAMAAVPTLGDDFEDGDTAGWGGSVGTATAVTSPTPPQGAYAGEFGFGNSCRGQAFPFTPITPEYIRFWMRAGAEGWHDSGMGVRLTGEDSSGTGVWLTLFTYHAGQLRFSPVAGVYTPVAGASLNTWYQIGFENIDWVAHTFDVFVDGALAYTGAAMMDDAVNLRQFQAYYCDYGVGGTLHLDDIEFGDYGFNLTGRVTLDGEGLGGVEVFLIDEDGPHYACTDGDGYYQFPAVQTAFFVATGPEVNPSIPCDNPMFLDPSAKKVTPLVAAVVPFFPDGYAVSDGDSIDIEVSRLPMEQPGLFNQMRAALIDCYQGDGTATWDNLAGYHDRVDKKLGKGKISPEAAELYHRFANTLGGVADSVCPAP